MSEFPIPLHFAEKKTVLNWADLLWGYRKALLTWKDLVKVAEKNIMAGSDDALEIELAGVDKESVWNVAMLAEKLAERSPSSESVVKRKWLFLTLAWAYECRLELNDPLGRVEDVYADFDYPPEIESFVRYMPPTDGYVPSQHSMEENHQRLMGKWKEFLDNFHSSSI